MSLALSCLDRTVEIPDKGQVSMGAPSVQEVLQITTVAQNLEDEDDVELLFELLSKLDWSEDISDELRQLYSNNKLRFIQFVNEILYQGYEPIEQTEKATDTDREVSEPDWGLLIAKVCRTQAASAREVYTQWRFPFFMEVLKSVNKEEARRHINRALEAGFAMGGSEETMNAWQDQAGFADSSNKVKDISEAMQKHNEKVLAKRRNGEEE